MQTDEETDRLETITFKCQRELVLAMEDYRLAENLTRSEMVRLAVVRLLQSAGIPVPDRFLDPPDRGSKLRERLLKGRDKAGPGVVVNYKETLKKMKNKKH